MQLTETQQKEPTEASQLRSNWWLVPSFLSGAAIWAGIIVALVS
jgi:hypothetical protein